MNQLKLPPSTEAEWEDIRIIQTMIQEWAEAPPCSRLSRLRIRIRKLASIL
jgi:hypothetical protein